MPEESVEKRLLQWFGDMTVFKSELQTVFTTRNLPSFIRDWFLKRYSDSNGNVDSDLLLKQINAIIPPSSNWPALLDKLMSGEQVKILAKVRVNMDVKTSIISFALVDYGVDFKETIIPTMVWKKCKSALLCPDGDVWGVATLSYQEFNNGEHKIVLDCFNEFRPYKIDLDYYCQCRKYFSFDEWIDILLGAMDYNPAGYESRKEKFYTLYRLIPFVEKRVNLIELAPKGTGKSYVFSNISKRGWLSSGGVMTRAKMFYDMAKKQHGLVSYYDYVALDEVATIRFPDVAEMQGALKGYLETGKYTVGNKDGSGDAGIVLLGNIPVEDMDVNHNMVKNINSVLSDSALLDRFHGFIKGWKIPRMREAMKMNGTALNTEYFAEILHAFREDVKPAELVEQVLKVPDDADTRDTTAVKRIATALVKLLFPGWRTLQSFNKVLFEEYCLKPAMEMRAIIRTQMALIDSEYKNKPLPEFTVK